MPLFNATIATPLSFFFPLFFLKESHFLIWFGAPQFAQITSTSASTFSSLKRSSYVTFHICKTLGRECDLCLSHRSASNVCPNSDPLSLWISTTLQSHYKHNGVRFCFFWIGWRRFRNIRRGIAHIGQIWSILSRNLPPTPKHIETIHSATWSLEVSHENIDLGVANMSLFKKNNHEPPRPTSEQVPNNFQTTS